jgi:putative transposase
MLEQSHTSLSLRRQCWLLSVSRAGLAYQPAPVDEQNLQIMRRLDTWYVEHPDLGHRRLVVLLREEGWVVNIKRVRRLRALMGLETQFPKPNLSKPGTPRQRFFYLLKGLIINTVHQVWATDITYIPMPRGFFYVMAILDLHSRYVLHWQLSNTLEADWCVETLRQSLQAWGKPQIFNTDQGSQFTSDDFVGLLQDQQVAISWDGKGRALDNIYVERFWPVRRCGTLKYEDIYLRNYQTGSELRAGLTKYFHYYNHQRPHQSLGYRTPVKVLTEGKEKQNKSVN